MKIEGTHHIALRTTNFEQLRKFYVETLGFPIVGAFAGHNIVFLGIGSTTIELVEATDGERAGTLGWAHLALEVTDTDATYHELLAQGIRFHVLPKDFPEKAPAVRIAFFKDPDGNELELVQALASRYPSAS